MIHLVFGIKSTTDITEDIHLLQYILFVYLINIVLDQLLYDMEC